MGEEITVVQDLCIFPSLFLVWLDQRTVDLVKSMTLKDEMAGNKYAFQVK